MSRRRNLIGEPWTTAEDDALRRLARPRPRQRSRHCLPWPKLFVALPTRSKTAIVQRCRELGLRPRSGSAWTDEETRLLAARWSEVGQRTLLDALPGRSWMAIHSRAMSLGLPTIPQGWETLKTACVRCGLDRETGLNVIRWAERQAEVVRAPGRRRRCAQASSHHEAGIRSCECFRRVGSFSHLLALRVTSETGSPKRCAACAVDSHDWYRVRASSSASSATSCHRREG